MNNTNNISEELIKQWEKELLNTLPLDATFWTGKQFYLHGRRDQYLSSIPQPPQDKMDVLEKILKEYEGYRVGPQTFFRKPEIQSLISSLFSPAAQPTEVSGYPITELTKRLLENPLPAQPAAPTAEDWENEFINVCDSHGIGYLTLILKNWIKSNVPKVVVGLRWVKVDDLLNPPGSTMRNINSKTPYDNSQIIDCDQDQMIYSYADEYRVSRVTVPKEEIEVLDESTSLSDIIDKAKYDNPYEEKNLFNAWNAALDKLKEKLK